MAHEIEIVDGKASMAYVGQKPWHGLGVKVDENITPHDMMVAAGLDWEVEKIPTYVKIDNEDVYTGADALVRKSDNKIFDTVGKDWNPVQNKEAFEFFCDFVEKGDMHMDTAGSLKDGRIVWALAKLKKDFTLFNGDEVKGYLLFSNPHQYGKSIDVRFCAERVVCNNTLVMAMAEKTKGFAKISHSSKFNSERVKAIIGLADNKMDNFKQIAEILGKKQYKEIDVINYYGEIFGRSDMKDKDLSRTGEKAMEILESQPGADIQKGSYWQLFNSITYMCDHVLGRSNDSRLESSWFGLNASKKQKALQLALSEAQK